ncbi:MAG: helix-turn-helix transcriptional regulator [Akkermansiaceae bacterium]|nr:helix-turn-helix transcriptional regulator [Akkermansiaceae bacterium]
MQSDQLASLISWHRRRSGLSQVELARHAGVSRYVVQDLEAGAGRTTWARMLPVLHALNIQLLPQGPLVNEWRMETKEAGS